MPGTGRILYENISREVVTVYLRGFGDSVPSARLMMGDMIIISTPKNLTTTTTVGIPVALLDEVKA